LKTRSDPWGEALESLARDHKIHSVDNQVLVSKVLEAYPKKKEYVLDTHIIGDTTYRRLRIMDKYDKVILELTDLELIDNKIYVRIPYRPRVSWFGYLFSRFYTSRGPNVHVNIRR
jgi:hypothetical protein